MPPITPSVDAAGTSTTYDMVTQVEINWVVYDKNSGDVFECKACLERHHIDDEKWYVEWLGSICESCYDNGWYSYCADCDSLFADDFTTYLENLERTVCNDCLREHYKQCADCEERWRRDDMSCTHRDCRICEGCYSDNYFCCDDCWEIFHNDDYGEDGYCRHCFNWGDSLEWDWWEEKDGHITSLSATDTSSNYLPLLIKETPAAKIWDYLEDFYGISEGQADRLPFNKRVDFNYTGNIELDSSDRLLKYLQDSMNYTDSKYRKYKRRQVEWVDKLMINFSYMDITWRRRQRQESFMKYHEAFHKEYPNKLSELNHNELTSSWFDIRMTNDIDVKIALCKANDSFGSCQIKCNRSGYAKWLRDFICDWAKVPIAIYKDNKIVWRQLVRYMLDKNGHEYLVLDRIYTTHSYGSYKKRMYREVYDRLLKTVGDKYMIAVPTNSCHDDSVRNYVNGNGPSISRYNTEETLRAPKRQRWRINSAYYHDSKTKTRGDSAKTFMYDYIQKWYYSINEKQKGLLDQAGCGLLFNLPTEKDETIKEISNESITPTPSPEQAIAWDVTGLDVRLTENI